jgi:hypothetical protein
MSEAVRAVVEHHQLARTIFVNPANPTSPFRKALADAAPRLPDRLEAST